MKPNLVLIIGDKAVRYVNGKAEQVVQIDLTVGTKAIQRDIEYFRVNGLEFETEQS
jgi:hypothetical protein